MKITTIRKFEKLSKEIFGQSNILSLSNFSRKVRFDLGAEFVGDERIENAYQRAINIFRSLFNDEEVWLKVVVWDKKDELELTNFFIRAKILFKKEKKNFKVFYLCFDDFDQSIFSHILKPILGFEMGYAYGLNIGCIYYNFDTRVILNVYDDRGMDVLILDKAQKEVLEMKFSDLLNYHEKWKPSS